MASRALLLALLGLSARLAAAQGSPANIYACNSCACGGLDPCALRPNTVAGTCKNKQGNLGFICSCATGFDWDPRTSSCLRPDFAGFFSPSSYKVIQACTDNSCQGAVLPNSPGNPPNVHSLPADALAIQQWAKFTPNTASPENFALQVNQNGQSKCVDVCKSESCGSSKGNVILYNCHYGKNQLWYFTGEADQFGGRLLKSVDNEKCLTACPAVDQYCSFVGDVSTAPCDPKEPRQRWAFFEPPSAVCLALKCPKASNPECQNGGGCSNELGQCISIQNKADGTSCPGGTCQAGTCRPPICNTLSCPTATSTECQTGGGCSNALGGCIPVTNKADGTACSAGTCQAGTCRPPVCNTLSCPTATSTECQTGGGCSNVLGRCIPVTNKADGTACSAGTCQAGSCKKPEIPRDPCNCRGLFLNGKCECVKPYAGPGCETEDPCQNVDCGMGGAYVQNGKCKCACLPGYQGERCDKKDPSVYIQCKNGVVVDGKCRCMPASDVCKTPAYTSDNCGDVYCPDGTKWDPITRTCPKCPPNFTSKGGPNAQCIPECGCDKGIHNYAITIENCVPKITPGKPAIMVV